MKQISSVRLRTLLALAVLLASSGIARAQTVGAAAESAGAASAFAAAPAALGGALRFGALSAPPALTLSAPLPAAAAFSAPAAEAPRAAAAEPVAAAASASPASAAAPVVAAAPAPALAAPAREAAPAALAAKIQAAAAPALAAAARSDSSDADLAGAGAALERALQGAPAADAPQAAPAFPAGSPLARVRVSEVAPNIFHLQFPTQHLLTATFLRFQEHYESPEYQGKVFTHKEFAAWYAKAFGKNGRFTYLDDWAGFNIPSRILTRFIAGDFNPLMRKERDFLALFAGRAQPFYIIGTYGEGEGDAETIRHEIAHGLYSTRRDYRDKAVALLKTVKLKSVFDALEKLGYHRRSWLDEAHAYLGDDLADLRKEGVDTTPYEAVHAQLLALYHEYFDAPTPAAAPAAPPSVPEAESEEAGGARSGGRFDRRERINGETVSFAPPQALPYRRQATLTDEADQDDRRAERADLERRLTDTALSRARERWERDSLIHDRAGSTRLSPSSFYYDEDGELSAWSASVRINGKNGFWMEYHYRYDTHSKSLYFNGASSSSGR
jgi:hypothetical protein